MALGTSSNTGLSRLYVARTRPGSLAFSASTCSRTTSRISSFDSMTGSALAVLLSRRGKDVDADRAFERGDLVGQGGGHQPAIARPKLALLVAQLEQEAAGDQVAGLFVGVGVHGDDGAVLPRPLDHHQ